jgi:hypothetical protein
MARLIRRFPLDLWRNTRAREMGQRRVPPDSYVKLRFTRAAIHRGKQGRMLFKSALGAHLGSWRSPFIPADETYTEAEGTEMLATSPGRCSFAGDKFLRTSKTLEVIFPFLRAVSRKRTVSPDLEDPRVSMRSRGCKD